VGRTRSSLAAASVRRLRESLTTLHSAPDPHESLQDVCDALNDLLTCHLAVVNLVVDDRMVVAAYSGTADGSPLEGRFSALERWYRMLDESESWGELRFCRDPRPYIENIVYEHHADPILLMGDDESWGSLNLLIAPMWSTEGDLVGAVTFDCPAGEPLPDELMLTVLEMFTAQAGIAIHQSRLAARAAADHLALQLSEERYRLAFDNAPVGIIELTADDGRVMVGRVNQAVARMLGVTTLDVRDKLLDDVFQVIEGEPIGPQLVELMSDDRRAATIETRLRRADGSDFWGLLRAAPLPETGGGRAGVICQIVDITKNRADAQALEQRARHDPLTGLPNRLVVLDRLTEVVRDAATTGNKGALLFCDLDNFKTVNDEHGHLVGDDVLAELAHRLGGVLRKEDIAGRFGGDEFVLVTYPVTAGNAKALGDRVSQALSEPMVFDGTVLRVSVSIGIAVITGSVEPAEVLRRADAAMYAVRSRRHRPAFVVETA
jgi:diguanylate cyclase (GGDEF)-like protein/PAS domain S-box-containing protein